MDKVLRTEKRLCLSCMEFHDVQLVDVLTSNSFKNTEVEYHATYFFCDRTNELFSDEKLTASNDISMKNAYRKLKGLLTSDEIIAIRQKYCISQRDLCLLLGWGEKTITRYECHQVQDFAHDSILRKLDDDPAWFLSLLDHAKKNQIITNVNLYKKNAEILFGENYFQYRHQAISARRFRNISSKNSLL